MWLVVFPPSAPGRDPITEIAYIDPGELPGESGGSASAPGGMPSAPVSTAPPATVMGDPNAPPAPVIRPAPNRRFERAERTGLVAPNPEAQTAFSDRLESRLASLKADATASPRLGSLEPPTTTSSLWKTPATISGAGGSGGSSPIELRRGGQEAGRAAPGAERQRWNGRIGRGRERETASAAGWGMEAATPAAVAVVPSSRRSPPPAFRPTGRSGGGRRGRGCDGQATLAGASLAGPIADGRIVSYARPVYPDWAKREESRVGDPPLPRAPGWRHPGERDGPEDRRLRAFDMNAVEALRAWRFASLPAGRTGDEWGTITFNYRLRDTP